MSATRGFEREARRKISTQNDQNVTTDVKQSGVSDIHVNEQDILAALRSIPVAELDKGVHKFVFAEIVIGDEKFHFVRSKTNAKYHYMVSESLIEELLLATTISEAQVHILGGGRCRTDYAKRKVFVYGYSNQYGPAPLEHVVQSIESDPKFVGWDISYSYEGY